MSRYIHIDVGTFLKTCFCGLGYGFLAVLASLTFTWAIFPLFPSVNTLAPSPQQYMLMLFALVIFLLVQAVLIPACISFGIMLSLRLLRRPTFRSVFTRLFLLTLVALVLSGTLYIGSWLYYARMSAYRVVESLSWTSLLFIGIMIFITAVDCAAVGIVLLATLESWLRFPSLVRIIVYALIIFLSIRLGIWIVDDVVPNNDTIGFLFFFSPPIWLGAFAGTLVAMRKQNGTFLKESA